MNKRDVGILVIIAGMIFFTIGFVTSGMLEEAGRQEATTDLPPALAELAEDLTKNIKELKIDFEQTDNYTRGSINIIWEKESGMSPAAEILSIFKEG